MQPSAREVQQATSVVRVDLGARGYDIAIGPGLLAGALARVEALLQPTRVFLVTHPSLLRLHGETVRRSGRAPEVLLVPAGERQKSLRQAARLYDALLARGADRRAVIVAFGGGVIGDLAGFVAATYMRGVAFVQLPTTLLAQVDASVGGKVAVDHPQAKNLIGAFYQPRLVVADSEVLRTLPAREYRAGLAEVVKHGVIADESLFAWMEASVAAIARRESSAIERMVRRSCEIKAEVVRRDEREEGLRAILNFGHTAAHALETLTGYRRLRHGEAVAIGMVVAARLSECMGKCEPGLAGRIARLLKALRLPTHIEGLAAADIVGAMQSDKKALTREARFVLVRRLGEVEEGVTAPRAEVQRALIDTGARE